MRRIVRSTIHLHLRVCLATLSSASAYAAEPTSLAVPGLLQTVLGLLVVLVLLMSLAWFAKRAIGRPTGASGALKVIGGVAVGTRERVVVVEVGGTWLVLGVAPGQVNALHSMPRIEPDPSAPAGTSANFPAWLKQMVERRGQNG